ncbi:MFS transporter, partial [Streptomyces sp. NPDC058861]
MTTTSDAAPAPPAAVEPPPLDRRRRNIVFGTIMLGVLLAALDQTIVGTALPTIVADLGGAPHKSGVLNTYQHTCSWTPALPTQNGDHNSANVVYTNTA